MKVQINVFFSGYRHANLKQLSPNVQLVLEIVQVIRQTPQIHIDTGIFFFLF